MPFPRTGWLPQSTPRLYGSPLPMSNSAGSVGPLLMPMPCSPSDSVRGRQPGNRKTDFTIAPLSGNSAAPPLKDGAQVPLLQEGDRQPRAVRGRSRGPTRLSSTLSYDPPVLILRATMPRILYQTRFKSPDPGWDATEAVHGREGLHLDPAGGHRLNGTGIHTRNGDTIELAFEWTSADRGAVRFGLSGGMESAVAAVDFNARRARLDTSDWTVPQPVDRVSIPAKKRKAHTIRISKTEGAGDLVKRASIRVELDDRVILAGEDVDILPEIGVTIAVAGAPALLKRFVHRGIPSGIPEYLHVGGWQVVNTPDIDANLLSIQRGLEEAADRGIELLVTPETSLTGLFPRHRVTQDPKPVAAAERKLRRFIKGLRNAPHCVVGLPTWESVPGHARAKTRYNVSRVYDPDGNVVDTYPKIHSCETEFWHGFRLQEFDVNGVPVCMHICHDGRYPETWTMPVMFGSRLILHPSNGGRVRGSVDAFEKGAGRSTSTSHAFYVNVNGGGGSWIAGPQKFDNVHDVSAECRRDNTAFPMVGAPVECMVASRIRVHDAFGYWPVRSFRASEDVAAAQLALYRALGGNRA